MTTKSTYLLVLGFACVAPICALAQTQTPGALPTHFSQDFINRRSNLSALGVHLFGDQTSLSTGTTEFAATDIDLEGNNALPVRLSRRYSVQTGSAWPTRVLGDWDLDLPYLHGTFAATSGSSDSGWKVSTSGAPYQRCSIDPNNPQSANPPNATGDGAGAAFGSTDFWHGNELHVPGQSNQPLMAIAPANANRPTNGMTSRWATENNWIFGCLATTANGVAGEAFLAMAPDGTKYWFDWFARAPAGPVTISGNSGGFSWSSTLARESVYVFPTRVEDRFGNYVTYTYDAANPQRLLSIQSSDGRSIQLSYNASGRVQSATAGTRTWTYTYGVPPVDYGVTTLTRVTLPDSSHWDFDFATTLFSGSMSGWFNCADIGLPTNGTFTKIITHPSGALGTFTFQQKRMGRSYVEKVCFGSAPLVSKYVDVVALSTKQISGPGLSAPQVWSFAYGPVNASWTTECAGGCATTRVVTVSQPDNSAKRYTFGNRFNSDEGKLLSLEVLSPTAQVLRTDTSVYELNSSGQPYPALLGTTPCFHCDRAGERPRPRRSTTISQQGVTFSRVVNSFDAFAREASVTASNTLGFTRSESLTYHDNLSFWALGQPGTHSINSTEAVRTEYDANAMPWKLYSFGLIQETRTYETAAGAQAGTPKTLVDGRGNVITLSNWKRGIPQLIIFPATAESPSGATDSVIVNNNGWIDSRVDPSGAQTCYGYDAMGRVSAVTYPTESTSTPNVCSTTSWNALTRVFEQVPSSEFGLPSGHWRVTESIGNARKIVYLDARWRSVLTRAYDVADQSGTQRFQRFGFDFENRPTFVSYPGATDALSSGTTTAFDALGRKTSVTQDSEIGPLSTAIEYLSAFQIRVTDPRTYASTTSFQVFDQPTSDLPKSLSLPEGAIVDIVRDVFGKPTSITRRSADNSVSVIRTLVYDSNQRLCKSIEPETAATVLDYDAAGNLAWSAAGLSLLSTSTCDRSTAQSSSRVVDRAYDSRNRLSSLLFSDGNGNQYRTYTADNLVDTVTTLNESGISVVNDYDYYKRRLVRDESLAQPGSSTWSVAYSYSGNGHLASVTHPGGSPVVDYAPNALGQPTQAGSYATSVTYHPNGSVHQFVYGNGITHTATQNTRQLPVHVSDAAGVMDYTYTYDANANVQQIVDALSSARTRAMQYDGLNRLRQTDSLSFGGNGQLTYTYDALDNLKTAQLVGVKQFNYGYDPSTNRLTSVTDNGGNSIYGFSYDVQGNLSGKNAQGFTFDYGNRLRSSEVNGDVVESYRYDGHGRRVMASTTATGNILSMYGQGGVLRHQMDERAGKSIGYIYLGTRLVARVSNSIAPGAPVVTTNPASFVAVGNYSVLWTPRAGSTTYEIQESVNAGAWQGLYTGSAVSHAITGRSAGLYSYRARACNGIGCSAWSVATLLTVGTAPTTAPTISVPATGPNGNYTVSWSSVSDATSYTLRESANGGAWGTAYSGASLSNGFSGKAAGSYAYHVMACNAIGCGPASSNGTVQVVYPPTGAPALTAPSLDNDGAYTVSWTSVSGATSYRLEEALNGGAWNQVADTASTSAALSGKPAGTHSYRARACNVAGCGPYSGVSTTQVTFPPSSAPTLSVPSPGGGSYTVSWTSVATAATYLLEENPNGAGWSQVQNSAALSYAASGKSPGSYSYRVKACNAGGCGPTSSTGVVTVLAPPATPVQSVLCNVTQFPPIQTTFTISWTSVSGATSYESQSSVGSMNYTGTGTWYQHTKPGGPLVNGVMPQFRVRALNAGGASAWSNYITPNC